MRKSSLSDFRILHAQCFLMSRVRRESKNSMFNVYFLLAITQRRKDILDSSKLAIDSIHQIVSSGISLNSLQFGLCLC